MFLFFMPSIIGFKSPATPIMEGIVDLHNYIFFYLILVFVLVLWMFGGILVSFFFVPKRMYSLVCVSRKQRILYSRNRWIIKLALLYSLPLFTLYNYWFGATDKAFQRGRDVYGYPWKFEFEEELVIYTLRKLRRKVKTRFKEIIQLREVTEHTLLEIVWTILPSLILVAIALPSFSLLYAMDEVIDPHLTVKVVGYQWFWSYEYSQPFKWDDFEFGTDIYGYTHKFRTEPLIFDSVMLTDEELIPGYHRLLEVDSRLILPEKTHIRVIVTGADVIHSWAVPAFGVKVDAVPGRLSQAPLFVKHIGVYYGQCSEICGINHGFMPIAVEVVDQAQFLKWYQPSEIIWYADETTPSADGVRGKPRVKSVARIDDPNISFNSPLYKEATKDIRIKEPAPRFTIPSRPTKISMLNFYNYNLNMISEHALVFTDFLQKSFNMFRNILMLYNFDTCADDIKSFFEEAPKQALKILAEILDKFAPEVHDNKAPSSMGGPEENSPTDPNHSDEPEKPEDDEEHEEHEDDYDYDYEGYMRGNTGFEGDVEEIENYEDFEEFEEFEGYEDHEDFMDYDGYDYEKHYRQYGYYNDIKHLLEDDYAEENDIDDEPLEEEEEQSDKGKSDKEKSDKEKSDKEKSDKDDSEEDNSDADNSSSENSAEEEEDEEEKDLFDEVTKRIAKYIVTEIEKVLEKYDQLDKIRKKSAPSPEDQNAATELLKDAFYMTYKYLLMMDSIIENIVFKPIDLARENWKLILAVSIALAIKALATGGIKPSSESKDSTDSTGGDSKNNENSENNKNSEEGGSDILD